jgi:hypothetical protein
MNKKNAVGTVNAGGAVVIIIFVVLCLAVFGTLSFSAAFADKRLADRNLESVTAYYRADLTAEEKLAGIYDALAAKISAGSPEVIFDAAFAESALGENFDIIMIEEAGENTVRVIYSTDMENSRTAEVRFFLRCAAEFQYTKANRLSYRITEWRVIMESDFDYGGGPLNIWTPD